VDNKDAAFFPEPVRRRTAFARSHSFTGRCAPRRSTARRRSR
jgi:hypothetical protein